MYGRGTRYTSSVLYNVPSNHWREHYREKCHCSPITFLHMEEATHRAVLLAVSHIQHGNKHYIALQNRNRTLVDMNYSVYCYSVYWYCTWYKTNANASLFIVLSCCALLLCSPVVLSCCALLFCYFVVLSSKLYPGSSASFFS